MKENVNIAQRKKKNDKCSDSIIILQGFGRTLF